MASPCSTPCVLDVFTAGASFSGIADLVKLKETSHKFESHYDGILLGTDDTSDPGPALAYQPCW